ncbi:glycoside hydrolase family 36 protein [Leifsonia sp. NPDC080035]|uniref:Glycoside hydrolase family 36 protein n=1 Tax=Leifsonia sp. NPDC080035 TaxID=3143936 RepID=A0AAU7GGQ1_9MICO
MTQNIVEDRVWFPGAPADAVSYSRTVDEASGLRVSVLAAAGSALPELMVRGSGAGLQLEAGADGDGPFTLSLSLPLRDPVTLWTPGSEVPHGTMPASWADARRISALDGVAIGCLLTTGDRAALTYGAETEGAPLSVRGGVVEETAELLVAFETERPGAVLRVRVDLTGGAFAESVRGIGAWLGRDVPASSSRDERPVFCTWYYAHQDVRQDDLQRQAERAAGLGFGTVIVDDGWQTGEHERGYGSAGDWRPDGRKLPDPRGLTSRLESLGLATMWWIGTPFLGERSDAYGNPALPILYEVPELDAAVLDVRSPAARRHITDRAIALLAEAGGDGFKLDFLERFARPVETPPPADADHDSAEDAALTLVRELVERARQVRPELMVELREPYIGADIRALASMVRVEDCPVSPVENRVGIADLRLVAPGTAVHSDPVMWAESDSPSRVAHQLLSAIMGVPQVSADLIGMRHDHAEVLAFWLGFWTRNADTILHGRFLPRRPDLSYPVMEAQGESAVVIVRYAPVAVRIPAGEWRSIAIANADQEEEVPILGAVGGYRLEVRDARGRLVSDERTDRAPAFARIPSGGLATLTR